MVTANIKLVKDSLANPKSSIFQKERTQMRKLYTTRLILMLFILAGVKPAIALEMDEHTGLSGKISCNPSTIKVRATNEETKIVKKVKYEMDFNKFHGAMMTDGNTFKLFGSGSTKFNEDLFGNSKFNDILSYAYNIRDDRKDAFEKMRVVPHKNSKIIEVFLLDKKFILKMICSE